LVPGVYGVESVMFVDLEVMKAGTSLGTPSVRGKGTMRAVIGTIGD